MMFVEKLDRTGSTKGATVILSYDDIRDISNLLYGLQQDGKLSTENELRLKVDFGNLHAFLHNGNFDDASAKSCLKTYEAMKEFEQGK